MTQSDWSTLIRDGKNGERVMARPWIPPENDRRDPWTAARTMPEVLKDKSKVRGDFGHDFR